MCNDVAPGHETLADRIRFLEKELENQRWQYDQIRVAGKNYKRFLSFLPYPVLVRDHRGLITYLNPAFTRTFGWTLKEFKGKKGNEYIPAAIRGELLKEIRNLPVEQSVLKLNSKRKTKSGLLLDVKMRVGVDRDENSDPREIIIVFRDVTREERDRRNQDAMNRISKALPQYPDLRDLMQYVTMEIKELLEAEGAAIILLDESEKEFVFLGAAQENPGNQEKIKKARFAVDELLSGQVVKTGEPIIMNSFPKDQSLHRNRDRKLGKTLKNMMAVPLRTKESIIGVIVADNKKRGGFDQADLKTLNTISGTVALSIENARITEKLKKANKDLMELNAGKDQMLAHLSHELKTPVAILTTSIKILSQRIESLPKETWSPTLERIQRNLDRIIGIDGELSDIVQDQSHMHRSLFSFIFDQCGDEIQALIAEEIGETGLVEKVREKIESIFSPKNPEMAFIDLNRFVKNRLKILSPQFAHRNIDLTVRLNPSSSISIPVEVLEKVMDGLIRNAVENTPDYGRIEIRVCKNGGRTEFMVRDHGVGLIKEAGEKIFEGFFSQQDTLKYSSKRPFDFNAGGKGADLLRSKIFSERYGFRIRLTSKRCSNLLNHDAICPGNRLDCNDGHDHPCDGMTEVVLSFASGNTLPAGDSVEPGDVTTGTEGR